MTKDWVESNVKKNEVMSAFIKKEEFTSLTKGDKMYGHGRTFTIKLANCGGPGKYPTHLVTTEMNGGEDSDFIFHDGENIKYSCSENKERDGAIVGELIDDGNCRIITKI